ncbi:hypothetical protein IJG04_03435 [Candidatus Saccharibacteria bacterium]|nr:hypothetical protein [Candidatus Saccharibacteria bacterium]
MHGETTVTGNWAEDTSSSLSCEANNTTYPIFEQPDTKGNIKINIIFDSNDTPSIMSLLYKTQYGTESDATSGRVLSSKALEEKFASDGLNADSLGVTYTSLDGNIFQMNLYATGNDINNSTYKYFMLDNSNSTKSYTLDSAKQSYQKAGFNCTISE